MAKTKALISCAVTVQLICTFVFAYAKSWSSHDAAHLIKAHHEPFIQRFKDSNSFIWTFILCARQLNINAYSFLTFVGAVV